MGWSESERGCKKHAQYYPAEADDNHMMMMKKQISPSPGVCSACLTEKLSQLYAPSSTFSLSDRLQTCSSISHDPSNYSSASSSTCESPVHVKTQRGHHHRHHHKRATSEMNVLGSISFMIRSRTRSAAAAGDHGLMKKSRSVAVVSKSGHHHHHFGEHHQVKKMSSSSGGSGKKKIRAFWSKLLRTKDVFKHPKSSLR